jgi:pilus assembly protein FimV
LVANLEAVSDDMTLDFDLGEQTVAPELKASGDAIVDDLSATVVTTADALDFDLGTEAIPQEPRWPWKIQFSRLARAESGAIDFDLNIPQEPLLDQASATASSPDFSPEGTLVMPSASVNEDFDVGLGTWVGVDGEGGAVDTASANPEPVDRCVADADGRQSAGRYRHIRR